VCRASKKNWEVAVTKNREREADEKRVQSQPTLYRGDPIYENENSYLTHGPPRRRNLGLGWLRWDFQRVGRLRNYTTRLWTGVGGGIQRRDGCQQVGRAPRDATSGISCRMFWALDPCTSFRFTARPKRTTAWAASRVPFWQSRVPFWPVHGSRAVHRNHDTSKSDIFGTRVASRVPFFKKMVHEYRWALVALAKRRM
jgi:hypothetical protein